MKRIAHRELALAKTSRAKVVGSQLYWYDAVGSTNDLAKDLATQGTPEGTLVVADEQKSGRGRRGAQWISPPGSGLWFSIVLYPKRTMADAAAAMNRLGAEAVAAVLTEHYDIDAKVKEPNDVLVDGKKICGILCETATAAGNERPDYLVIGCGLNLTTEFPQALLGYATDMVTYTKEPPDAVEVLARICEALEARYLI